MKRHLINFLGSATFNSVVICAPLCYSAKIKPRTPEIPDKILHTTPADTIVVFGREGS